MTDHPTSKNADGLFEPFNTNEVPVEEYGHGDRFALKYQRLGAFGGGTRVGVEIDVLEPGKQAYPAHYHMLEEEHVLVLDGELTLRLGDKTFLMKTGDYVCFPAGQKQGHALINTGTKPCRYLVVGESNPNEVVVYTDSGRVGVRALGEGYRRAATMEYWEGEG